MDDADQVAGGLVVVGTPIGNLADLSPRAADALRDADLVLAEDTRRTGRLLAHVAATAPQRSFHEHNERQRLDEVLGELRRGARVALVSDAGMPGISDPGYRLVAACHEAGIAVEVVPGPSAVVLALVGSGLPTDRFAFEGFLPRRGGARRERLAQLAVDPRTLVLFVAPHRAAGDLRDLAGACGDARPAALARELTKLHEEVVRATLGELAAQVATDGARGELTLVVGGAAAGDDVATPDPKELVERVRALMATGLTKKAAIAEVASAAGVPRREVYQAVIDAGS